VAGAVVARSLADGRGGPMDSVRKALPGKSHSHGISLPKFSKRGSGMKGGMRNISKSFSQAAKQADQVGQRVSKVAQTVQHVTETADDAVKKV
jgi:monoamine oxidase